MPLKKVDGFWELFSSGPNVLSDMFMTHADYKNDKVLQGVWRKALELKDQKIKELSGMTLFSLFFILSERWAMQLVGRAAPVSQYSEFNIIRHRARSSHNESRRLLTLPCQPGACTSPCAPDVRPNAYSHVYQRRRRDPPPSNCTSDEEGWDGG